MNLISYRGMLPKLMSEVFVADGVQIIGDVQIGDNSSIWYNTVMRGDLAHIRVGSRCNLQDGVIAHVNRNQPLLIDEEVSVGHGAIVHGCEIARGCLVGMGAIVLNGAKLNEFVLLGAGSVVTENAIIPAYTLAVGSPARVIRELREDDLLRMARTTQSYVDLGREWLSLQKGETRIEIQ